MVVQQRKEGRVEGEFSYSSTLDIDENISLDRVYLSNIDYRLSHTNRPHYYPTSHPNIKILPIEPNRIQPNRINTWNTAAARRPSIPLTLSYSLLPLPRPPPLANLHHALVSSCDRPSSLLDLSCATRSFKCSNSHASSHDVAEHQRRVVAFASGRRCCFAVHIELAHLSIPHACGRSIDATRL